LHDILTADHFSPINRWIAVQIANLFVDRVIVNSEATRDAFAECGGRRDSTRLVYNGLDGSDFDRGDSEMREHLRTEWGVQQDTTCVGIFSRLSSWKGQHVLLDAIAPLQDAHAVIVGDALFDGDKQYAQRLRAQARELGISDRVHFLGFQPNIPDLMHAVDIIVHASTAAEPFGRVIVEGQLARRPVIATRAGGAAEIIEDGTNGYLTAPGDAQELCSVLQQVIADRENLVPLIKEAEETARTRYSVRQMIDGIQAVIREVSAEESPANRTRTGVARPAHAHTRD
jgi:glycosyltransferase involved in cell wall biosynthesis